MHLLPLGLPGNLVVLAGLDCILAVDIHLDLEVDRAAAQAGLVDHNLAGLAGLEAVPAEIAAAAVDSPAAAVDSPVAAVDIHLAVVEVVDNRLDNLLVVAVDSRLAVVAAIGKMSFCQN